MRCALSSDGDNWYKLAKMEKSMKEQKRLKNVSYPFKKRQMLAKRKTRLTNEEITSMLTANFDAKFDLCALRSKRQWKRDKLYVR